MRQRQRYAVMYIKVSMQTETDRSKFERYAVRNSKFQLSVNGHLVRWVGPFATAFEPLNGGVTDKSLTLSLSLWKR